ncbi:DnaJ domain-containing protein, partial [Oscillatoria sp. CS-180]|uniref:DnaJ domain-containing protein n=1 Tax=Oscillatoria sp. CS-180 TaxID=3021720 RepID=UPI00232F72C5
MRIPLDYYRILGLPIQATADQLKQAHRDRTLQLPRREYSDIAIKSRKSLIDEAYALLSNAEKRQTYDTQFLTRTHPPEASVSSRSETVKEAIADFSQVGEEALRSLASNTLPEPTPEPYTPTIEIDDTQFVGALLILLELGEYELVIRLGRPFVANGQGSLSNGSYGEPSRVQEDIVLTLALACLELGREQWQQNQYENAAESLETGQELLLKENGFPAIRAELQSDLFKLRPYRILELVARPLEQTGARRQGIQLLKTMLQDRGGIDGVGDDLSGLSTDDFLRFIQQLRGYLTAGEQQEIFEAEARRPSAVATYLAVYALLARGFSFHQPALIRRAKQLLQPVSTRQDVHLEQAVCALLLGQAEEAGRALELSQEYEPLAFIREHSQSSPDLLPGLCLYAERWLREEVFTHFRDLANQQTALKDYFADPQVQAFLEAMPASQSMETSLPYRRSGMPDTPSYGEVPFSTTPTAPPMQSPVPAAYSSSHYLGTTRSAAAGDDKAVSASPSEPQPAPQKDVGLSIAERVSQLSPDGQLQSAAANRTSPQISQNGHRPSAAVSTTEPELEMPPPVGQGGGGGG